jgi:hypothetical protein
MSSFVMSLDSQLENSSRQRGLALRHSQLGYSPPVTEKRQAVPVCESGQRVVLFPIMQISSPVILIFYHTDLTLP